MRLWPDDAADDDEVSLCKTPVDENANGQTMQLCKTHHSLSVSFSHPRARMGSGASRPARAKTAAAPAIETALVPASSFQTVESKMAFAYDDDDDELSAHVVEIPAACQRYQPSKRNVVLVLGEIGACAIRIALMMML